MNRSFHVFVLALVAMTSPVFGQNMLGNPTFDTDLSVWENAYSYTAFWDSTDFNGSAASGSGWLVNDFTNGSLGILRQEFLVSAGAQFEFEAQVYPPSGQTGTGYGQVRLQFYPDAYTGGCLGNVIEFAYSTNSVVPDSWNHVSGSATAPAGTQCVTLYLGVKKWETGSTEEFGAYFDMVELQQVGLIFSDGFEDGSTSAWL